MSFDDVKTRMKNHAWLMHALDPAITLRRFVLRRRELRRQALQQNIRGDFLKNMSAILAEDPRVALEEFQGTFFINCQSDIFVTILASGHYEAQLARCCRARLNTHRDVIDVGANIGFYTIMFAKNLQSGKVLAIEPTPNAMSRLQKNIQLNGVQNKTIVFDGVASQQTGLENINVVVNKEEYSSMGHIQHPCVRGMKYKTLTVASATIDDLTERFMLDPGFMKIDVEGMEHMVLKGAGKVLSKHRPIILMEVSDYLLRQNGSSAAAVTDRIKAYGYKVCDPSADGMEDGNWKSGNVLCLPVEPLAAVAPGL